MLGYLFYDQRDIKRNQRFIDWLIDEALKHNLNLLLKSHNENLESLEKPHFVINRSRHHHISLYYNDLPIFNSALVTEIANDKLKTYRYFKDEIAMMTTCEAKNRREFPCIVKSKSGHGGQEVFWIHHKKDLETTEGFIAQDIASVVGRDLRVYILDNKIVAAILRTNSKDFKANYSLGGQAEVYQLDAKEIALIHKILAKLPLDYGGIDFLFDGKKQLILNEIEDVVGARMLYNLTDIKIVELYIAFIAGKLKNY